MKQRKELVSTRVRRLSIRRQCEILSVNRSSLYYRPLAEKPENLKIMHIMDQHALEHPAEGVLSMMYMLRQKGYQVNPKRVRRLLRKMGHRAVYPRPSLSKLGQTKYIYPYLLHKVAVTQANQAWSVDITYIPMQKGFMYCTAIIDIYSRKIMSWGVSNSLETQWCLDVLQDAIKCHGRPQMINSDQGSQFTSAAWTHTLRDLGIKISMDGKGRAIDNRWIERFWRTLKHKYIYLNPPKTGLDLYQGIKNYIEYYNHKKIHHTLKQTPHYTYQKPIDNQIRNLNINPHILTKKVS